MIFPRAMKRILVSLWLTCLALNEFAHGQPGLPLEVQADMLTRSIVEAYGSGNYRQVLGDLDRFHVLEGQGAKVPGPLLFIEAKIASESGNNVRAEKALRQYFNSVDKTDPRYQEALALYPKVQREMEAEIARINELKLASLPSETRSRFSGMPQVVQQLIVDGMVDVPAGRFPMGCSASDTSCEANERPTHEVTIRAFRMAKHEITFDQYDVFAAATGRDKPSDQGWGRGMRPVINVNVGDAEAYVQWLREVTGLRFRLPTEAEWEYAARAGSANVYSWGNEVGSNLANCDGCGSEWDDKKTAPVGSFAANNFGLFDMHGNVWEWVQDNWHDDYSGAPTDGSVWPGGDASRRVLRGGSWYDLARNLRASSRNWYAPAYRDFYVGFRVAQDL